MSNKKRSRRTTYHDVAQPYGAIREYESATRKYQRELEEHKKALED
mgnify:CR=1 FL=1